MNASPYHTFLKGIMFTAAYVSTQPTAKALPCSQGSGYWLLSPGGSPLSPPSNGCRGASHAASQQRRSAYHQPPPAGFVAAGTVNTPPPTPNAYSTEQYAPDITRASSTEWHRNLKGSPGNSRPSTPPVMAPSGLNHAHAHATSAADAPAASPQGTGNARRESPARTLGSCLPTRSEDQNCQ